MSLIAPALGAVIAIALVVVGVRRVYRASIVLKWRLASYAALPIRILIDGTLARVAVAEASINSLPTMLARAERARTEIAAAAQRVAVMARLVSTFFRRPVGP